ncbi:MAG: HAD family hydrolase [Spirochaetia bacterium]|jgi:phosphoglycolate phosphatase|nr:HAD family hydrolase [Spirochaetales bacterium]MDX9783475.1 HAD family hydrolase [Spirochaetia bacterium]
MIHTPRAVLFDLDGTLADTIEDLGGAFNSVLASRGYPVIPVERYKTMVGNGFMALTRRALPPEAAADELLVETVNAEAEELYSKHFLDRTSPFPEIPELLTALSERKATLAVLSNKPDRMVGTIVKELFPEVAFFVTEGNKPDRPHKPDPTATLAIVAASGIPASEWIFVGDSGVDMKTGRAAGMLPLGAAWGYRSREEIKAGGAAGMLETPMDLLNYFNCAK